MRNPISLLLFLLIAPAPLLAQPLADRVPGDATIYLGWQGIDAMPPAYQQSHLKEFLESSQLPQALSQFLSKLALEATQHAQTAGRNDKLAADVLNRVVAIGGPLARHPSAIYFSGIDLKGGEPLPRGALLCDAGGDAAALHEQFIQLTGMAQEAGAPLKTLREGNLVGLVLGYDDPGKAIAKPPANSLVAQSRFKEAMTSAQGDPICIAYADVEAILEMVDAVVGKGNDPQAAALWPKIEDASGISGIKSLIYTAGFQGKDWGTQCFISAPGTRKGLVALLEGKRISDEMLNNIPQSATWLAVGGIDLPRLLATVREIAGKVDPDAQKMFDQALGAAQMIVGVAPQAIFESLGREWAIYTDPESAGSGILGLTIVNKPANPAEAERALGKLELFINNLIASQSGPNDPKFAFKSAKAGDLTVHTMSVLVASPSWAISDGKLYIGLYPQAVVAAADFAKSKGKSISDNSAFVALRSRLGGEKAESIGFTDLPRTAGEGYQQIMMLINIATGAAEMAGVDAPPMLLPPLNRLKQHLAVAGSITWSDDAGWHMKSITPFPGAEMLGSQQGALTQFTAIAPALMLPALAKAREQASRQQGMSNLRQIGLGCIMYANDHNGQLPADLGSILPYVRVLEVFVSPSGGAALPPDIRTAKPEEQAKWINQNSDYVYLAAGALIANGAQGLILAHEKPNLHGGQGLGVLFGDGHVEWMSMPQAMQRIQNQVGNAPKP